MEDFTEYDIIETVRTEGFDYMRDIAGYLLVNDEVYENFKKYIESDKNCIPLLKRMCKTGIGGNGLYMYWKDSINYIKSTVINNDKHIVEVNIRSRRQLKLCNVYSDTDIKEIKNISDQISVNKYKQDTLEDFIEFTLISVNIKPDIFVVPCNISLGLLCNRITAFTGTNLFIRKADIESVVKSCSLIDFI